MKNKYIFNSQINFENSGAKFIISISSSSGQSGALVFLLLGVVKIYEIYLLYLNGEIYFDDVNDILELFYLLERGLYR